MTKHNFEANLTLDAATAEITVTKDGYMRARPRIARTGIQIYQGSEVGRPELKEVRVYRPESEVMSRDSVMSLAGKPVTIEHPDGPVNAQTWRDVAVGHVGDEIMRDGEFIRVPLHLMDAEAIAEVRKGRAQLSVGYTAELQWADGVTPDGEAYDVKQTAIRANHVAITHTARGGPKLRMGDRKTATGETNMRTILIDGISTEMEDRAAQLVERQLQRLEGEIASTKTALATAQTTAQNDVASAKTETANVSAVVATKDAEIATLKQQLIDAKLSPQKIDQMVADRAATVQRAKSIIGDALVVDGKTDADMRRQAVNAKLGDVAKDWNDDMVSASFNTLSVTTTADSGNGLQNVVSVLQNHSTSGDPRVKSYNEYEEALSNRWKNAGARTA